ncbi:MAG: Na(+)/H(+) antiporter subunit D [Deltaproteobacteria bacterium]|jgi:multicomponent Na+:H+ antiporter subunit D|nr:Na(+)/H(+) antiporter subunit D [Deltaproteobacteria bacterium]
MVTSNFFHPSIGFLMMAVVLPFLPGNRRWKWLLLIPPLAAIYAAFTNQPGDYLTMTWLGQTLKFGHVDALSSIFAQVFAIMSLAGILYALHVDDKGQHVAALLYVTGGFGCVFAGDYLTLFAFWELMSVGSTFLVMLNRTRESVLASFRYFIYHTVGGLFLLGGVLLRHKATGSFDFGPILAASAQPYDFLILAGFCVNAAVVPLHAWLPDAYPRGTVTGSVFMCAFTTKTAVYVLARAFPGWEILAIAGTVMAIFGVLYASMENNARRILSYHIVSQVGYMVAGIGVGTAITLNGASAHAYAHILYKGLLFMGAGAVLYSAGTQKLDELGGLAARLPWVMVFYMVAALSISGMPIFNGFVSKTMTIYGAAADHRTFVALGLELAAVGTFVSVGLKLPYFAFWGGKPTDWKRELKPIPFNMYLGMGLLAFMCVLQGVCPEILYRYLPYPEAVGEFQPWTAWNVLQASTLLGFAGLAFYLTRKVITPHKALNLDFDWFYRLIGRALYWLISRPAAFIDNIWTNVWNVVGLRGLMGSARSSVFFDKKIIDGVVDGSASGVKGIGVIGALLQNGKLQYYLGLMVVLALGLFAFFWYGVL